MVGTSYAGDLTNTKVDFIKKCKLAMTCRYKREWLLYKFKDHGAILLVEEKANFDKNPKLYTAFLYVFQAYKDKSPAVKYINYIIYENGVMPKWDVDIYKVDFNLIREFSERLDQRQKCDNLSSRMKIRGVLSVVLKCHGLNGAITQCVMNRILGYVG